MVEDGPRLWIEYNPDLSVLKICTDASDDLRVTFEEADSVIRATAGELMVDLPCPVLDAKNGSVVKSNEFQSCTIRLPISISSNWIHQHSTTSALYEDWTEIKELQCRACPTLIDCGEDTACLLPSATWGFEDMRVCEECAPIVTAPAVANVAHHNHNCEAAHSKSSSNIFISESSVYIDSGKACPCSTLTKSELSDSDRLSLKSVLGGEDFALVKIPKTTLGGCFRGYSLLSEALSFGLESGHKKFKFSDPLFVKFLTGVRDVLLIDDTGTYWGTKVMFCTDAALVMGASTFEQIDFDGKTVEEELKRFELPQEFSFQKGWKFSFLILPPVLVEL